MLDSIHIGVTALLSHQEGLRVIANNTANMNTPGFKGSSLQFSDLFDAAGGQGGTLGHGVTTAGTHLDFSQGELRQTGGEFDLALDGEGMFTLRSDQGRTVYARAGQFAFDPQGVFTDRLHGAKVLGVDAAGNTGEISLSGLRVAAGKATTTARFTGNLSVSVPDQTVGDVKVFDARGQEHVLTAKFTSTEATTPGSWKLELLDGAVSVGTTELVFVDGRPTAATSKPGFTYTPAGGAPQQLLLDFAADVTAFAAGSLSTLAMTAQDGYAPGHLTKVSFDASGQLVAAYSNGQTAKGPRLALGRFSTPNAVEDLGGSLFGEANGIAWQQGVAGEGGFATVRAGMLEMSNVDLSREFSDLVVMQRGYQAASQVVSTANDMLQELFGMKHK